MENKHLHRAIFVWVNICRFLLAGVFIFSGFIKANDPYGTAYKIQDYLEAWGFQHLIPDAFPYFGSNGYGCVRICLGILHAVRNTPQNNPYSHVGCNVFYDSTYFMACYC